MEIIDKLNTNLRKVMDGFAEGAINARNSAKQDK